MQNNLLSIFKAITPDNIKDIPVVEDSMRIFIEILKENSPISSDIRIALSEETTDSIAEELPKIYLNDYYDMIENLKTNKDIKELPAGKTEEKPQAKKEPKKTNKEI